MPSVSALQVKTGSPAPPPPDPDCAELTADVEAADQDIKKSINNSSRTPQSKQRKLDGHKASTVTSSKMTCGQSVSKETAYSSMSRLPKEERKNHAAGIKSSEKSNLCTPPGEKPFKHAPSNWSTTCTHTEGRLIEDKFGENPGQSVSGCEVVMKIKWKQRAAIKNAAGKITGWKEKKPKDVPCEGCKKTICRAQACGLKISLCRGNPPKKTDPDCKDKG